MPLTPPRRPVIPPAHLDLVRPGNLAGDMELIRDAQRVADEQAKDSSLDAVASMLHRAAHPSVRTQVHWFDFTCWNSYHRGMKSVISEKGQVTIPKRSATSLGCGRAPRWNSKPSAAGWWDTRPYLPIPSPSGAAAASCPREGPWTAT